MSISSASLAALFRLFRPTEYVKLQLSALLPDVDDPDELIGRKRRFICLVGNAERGVEEGSVFLLKKSTPSTYIITHILPVTPAFQVSIAQYQAVQLQLGQTVRSSGSSGAVGAGSKDVQFAVTFKADDKRKRGEVKVVVESVKDVEDLLAEIKRLKSILSDLPAKGVKSHSWLSYYQVQPENFSNSSRITRESLFKNTPFNVSKPPDFYLSGLEAENPFSSKAVRRSWVRKDLTKKKDTFCTKSLLKIHCATFNVNDKLPPSDPQLLQSMLGPHSDSDIFAFGFQELDLSTLSLVSPTSAIRNTAWTKALLSLLGDEYESLSSVQFVGVLLILLVKKSLINDGSIHKETGIQTHGVPIGLFGVGGNKAGVGIRVQIRDSVLVFVTSHLAAFANMKEKRNEDFEEIRKRLKFNVGVQELNEPPVWDPFGLTEEEDYCGIEASDVIFWMGDLNYRIEELDDDTIKSLVSSQEYSKILDNDQLNIERTAERAFKGYQEGHISFPPTFKYAHGTTDFDSKRAPAYTDRILWKADVLEDISVIDYQACLDIMISDHKPVTKTFQTTIRTVNTDQLAQVHAQCLRDLDIFENEHMPDLTISETSLDFGEVTWQQPSFRTIKLANNHPSVASFYFKPKMEGEAVLKPWAWCVPMEGVLLPGEEMTVSISVLVDAQSSPALNTGEDSLEDIIVLHVKGGKDIFMSIFGRYTPTCFGNTYTTLLRLPQPIRKVPRDDFLGSLIPVERCLSVAREIFRIIDWLSSDPEKIEDGGDLSSRLVEGLFVREGDDDLVDYIRECLDTGDDFKFAKLSGSLAPLSMGETLLQLLESMEPCVPGEAQLSCCEAKTVDEAYAAFDLLPTYSANLLIYLTSFLKTYIDRLDHNNNGTNKAIMTSKIALSFASVLLRSTTGTSTLVTNAGKKSFLLLLLSS